jgi:hypothetical protein
MAAKFIREGIKNSEGDYLVSFDELDDINIMRVADKLKKFPNEIRLMDAEDFEKFIAVMNSSKGVSEEELEE